MLEIFELFVACRRSIVLGAPPPGLLIQSQPWQDWKPLRIALPFPEAPAQVIELKRDGASMDAMFALARACARAADGIVLSVQPVSAPPRFQIEHDERGAPPMDWAGILSEANRLS